MKRFLVASAILASAAYGLGVPAAAQDDAGDKVNMVIVYGDDECPAPDEGEITVCARKAENERYRIPENLRFSESGENVAWTERVDRYEMVGSFGTMSCDPAGAGGFTGCTQLMIRDAYADREGASSVRFGQLIAAARAERLSTIDEDAADQQARVEQIEREYMERLERERTEALPGEIEKPGHIVPEESVPPAEAPPAEAPPESADGD